MTDGQCRSVVYPSIFLPGFDATPEGGQGLGRLGSATGETIAVELSQPAR